MANRRSKNKFPGLRRELNLRTKWDYLDQDYIAKLSDEEKQFLSNFNEEFYGGNFNHPGKKLHRSKKSKRECYGRNNSRNRDVFARSRAGNALIHLPTQPITEHAQWLPDPMKQDYPGQHEDTMVELIDLGLFYLMYLGDKIEKA